MDGHELGQETLGSVTLQAFSSVTEELIASQEDPWSIALVGLCMPQNAVTG